jgi:hypothetical protein
LSVVSQAYSWMPIVRIMLESFTQADANPFLFEWIPFFMFFAFLLLKPKFITTFLEAKYFRVLETLKKQNASSKTIKNEE